MKLPSIFNNGFLSEPGDSFLATITSSGRGVAKLLKADGTKRSATYYPSTGTIVETISRKVK